MPEGVEVTVQDGTATVVFTDPALRGDGITALLTAAESPVDVQKVTLPEQAYVVPEDVARQAGLLDGTSVTPTPKPAAVTAAPEPVTALAPAVSHSYDDGLPDMDWSRAALDEYAVKLGLDPKQYRNKDAVLDAIRAAG